MPHISAGCVAVYAPTEYVHHPGCICVGHPHQGCVGSMGYETYYDAHGNFAYYPAPHETSISMQHHYG